MLEALLRWLSLVQGVGVKLEELSQLGKGGGGEGNLAKMAETWGFASLPVSLLWLSLCSSLWQVA